MVLGCLGLGHTAGPRSRTSTICIKASCRRERLAAGNSSGADHCRVFPAGRDQGPCGGLDLAGERQPIRPPQAAPLPRRPAHRLGLPPSRHQHSAGRRRRRLEVFPTIEVIDRLYAPPGQECRFAIPVELTAGRHGAGPGRQVRHARDLPGRPAQRLAQPRNRQVAELVRGGAGARPAWRPPTSSGVPSPSSAWADGFPMPNPDSGFFFGSPPYVPCPVPVAIQPKPKAAAPQKKAAAADKAVQPNAKAARADERRPRRHPPLRRGYRNHERHFTSLAPYLAAVRHCRRGADPLLLPRRGRRRRSISAASAPAVMPRCRRRRSPARRRRRPRAAGPAGHGKGHPHALHAHWPLVAARHQHALAARRIPPRRRPRRPARHRRQPRRNPRPANGRHRRRVPDHRWPNPLAAEQSRLYVCPALRRRPASGQPGKWRPDRSPDRHPRAGPLGRAHHQGHRRHEAGEPPGGRRHRRPARQQFPHQVRLRRGLHRAGSPRLPRRLQAL